LIFHEKGKGGSPLPRKKLSPVDSTIEGSGTALITRFRVTRLETPSAIPNESNPGPTLAVVPGMETVTEVEGVLCLDAGLMLTTSIPTSLRRRNIQLSVCRVGYPWEGVAMRQG
jgi:hypothetical protein